MSEIGEQLAEDRALRNAALQLFKSDIALVRGDLDERGVGARAKDRLSEAALGMLDDAIDYAESNKGWIAAAAAAVVLWFARKPILGAIADLLDDGDEAEPGEVVRRSANEAEPTGDIR